MFLRGLLLCGLLVLFFVKNEEKIELREKEKERKKKTFVLGGHS
jgi:hypothetical protein